LIWRKDIDEQGNVINKKMVVTEKELEESLALLDQQEADIKRRVVKELGFSGKNIEDLSILVSDLNEARERQNRALQIYIQDCNDADSLML